LLVLLKVLQAGGFTSLLNAIAIDKLDMDEYDKDSDKDLFLMFTPLSYSHDTSREELIARFRDRIAQGERTKLTGQERSELVLHFVDRLAQCNTEEEAIALCKAEMALLEEGYPVASIANQYLADWRKAISRAVEEGKLPKQDLEPNEYGKIYPHWGLKHLLYPNEVHKALKEKTTTANNQKQDDLQPIRADRVITKAKDLLERETPHEWAAGLLALTGRRFSEIVAKGEFKPTSHPYAIAFRGQLKKGIQNLDEAQTFLIATLIERDKVMAALDKFRAHPRIQELAGLSPDEINSRFNTSIRHHIKREFEDTEIIPVLTGEKSVSAHNLRGVYAEIAVHYFCPPSQGTHRFIQAHLGHIIGEQELANRKNAGATEHYFHYRLIGAQGQQLNEKGILLERFGALPTPVELEPETAPPAIEASQESEPMTSTQAEAQTHTRKSRAHVPSELMHELKEVAARKLNADGSYAEVLEAVISFLQDDKTPTIASSIESLGSTFQWFTGEVERLREENRRLASERNQARAELDDLHNQTQKLGNLEALTAENARLQAEVAQFQQIKQMLGGGTGESAESPTPAVAQKASPGAISIVKPVVTPQRRIKDEDQALGKINEAIDAIMAWNNDSSHDSNHKWFISIPAILSLIRGSGFSASQDRVRGAMANRKEELDTHHEKHGLGQRHNTRHDQPITADIVL
jgi:Telomere resolvase